MYALTWRIYSDTWDNAIGVPTWRLSGGQEDRSLPFPHESRYL